MDGQEKQEQTKVPSKEGSKMNRTIRGHNPSGSNRVAKPSPQATRGSKTAAKPSMTEDRSDYVGTGMLTGLVQVPPKELKRLQRERVIPRHRNLKPRVLKKAKRKKK